MRLTAQYILVFEILRIKTKEYINLGFNFLSVQQDVSGARGINRFLNKISDGKNIFVKIDNF